MNTRLMVSCLGFSALLFGIGHSPLRLNITDSLPLGLWKIEPITHIERGTHAFFHSDEGRKLLKPISAVAGDIVQIRSGHPVTVNGREIPNTEAQPDKEPWPDGTYTVKPGEVWLFSSYNIKSYDSRYFGPVSVSTIQGEAIPLLVIDNSAKATGGPL